VRIISAETLLGYDERQKCDKIQKIFEDAYKSPKSLILLDNLERLLEYVPIPPLTPPSPPPFLAPSSPFLFANSVLRTIFF
jgi:hypothetical protein